ncbi:unnamed protein product [Chironomus riparius]|uniref:Odorant receptor n=1 Tax=Chironomus riparius TaxID=315576 RepID=A0A9N9WPJ5_9DIPT|nr:unnamed protein product [Chironomus riparius]
MSLRLALNNCKPKNSNNVKLFNKIIPTNIDTFVAFPVALFKIIELKFEISKVPETRSQSFKKFAVFMINVFNAVLVSALITIVLIRSYNVIFGIAFSLSFMMIIARYTTFFIYRSEIAEILEIFRKSFNSEEKYAGTLQNYLKRVKIIQCGYAVFVPTPLVLSAIKVFLKYILFNERQFDPKIYFPFDATRPEVYPFALFWVYWSKTTSELINIADMGMLFGMLSFILARFDILGQKFQNLKGIRDKSHFKTKLLELRVEHELLLKLTAQMDKIFSPSFFFSIVMSSYSICFLAFEASIAENIDHVIFYSSFAAVLCFTMFLQCLYGQKIKIMSEKVAQCVYECGWEQISDFKMRKDLIFIIKRAQKPATFTILNFGEVTLEQYGKVK